MMGATKCLTKTCLNTSAPALRRGLCMTCYSRAKRMVEAGTTTWDEIVMMGLALSDSAGGVDPFMAAFREAKEGKDAAGTGPG